MEAQTETVGTDLTQAAPEAVDLTDATRVELHSDLRG